jgi:esterase
MKLSIVLLALVLPLTISCIFNNSYSDKEKKEAICSKKKLEYIFVNENKTKNLLFLHGLGGSVTNILPALTSYSIKNEANIWAVSLRNHANSFYDPLFSIDALTQDIIEFIVQNKIKNVYLAGFSIGGRIAMNIAAKYPKYVKSIAVIDFMPFAYSEAITGPGILSLSFLASYSLANKTINEIRAFFSVLPPEDFAQAMSFIVGTELNYKWSFNLPAVIAGAPTLIKYDLPVIPFTKHIQFIFATKSIYFMESKVPDLVRYYPKLDLAKDVTYVENAVHSFPFTNPEIVLAFIDNFLRNN